MVKVTIDVDPDKLYQLIEGLEIAGNAETPPEEELILGDAEELIKQLYTESKTRNSLRREPVRRPGEFVPSRAEQWEIEARKESWSRSPEYYERQHLEVAEATDLAKLIGQYLNHGGDPVLLAQEITRKEHRTLQQKFMGICMAFIADEAKLGALGYYDLRNQATCALAQHLMDSLGEDADLAQHLPFI